MHWKYEELTKKFFELPSRPAYEIHETFPSIYKHEAKTEIDQFKEEPQKTNEENQQIKEGIKRNKGK